jgi:pSer/pThr/pTyr-binding forkhead associated (FHA) protein
MSRQLLVIAVDDRGQFFLGIDGKTVTLGDSPQRAEGVLRGLRISRIHCEVEVDDEALVMSNPTAQAGAAPLELHPGQSFQVGRSRLRLEAVPEDGSEAALSSSETEELPPLREDETTETQAAPQESAVATARLVKRLVVFDGADRGQTFLLPEQGTISVGQSHKNADIVLHDLYVSRVHCEITVDEDSVVVTHVSGVKGTLINGQPITQPQQLRTNDVLRVGNSHLRLEVVPADEVASTEPGPAEEEGEFEVVDEEEDVEVVEEDSEEAAEADSRPRSPIEELLGLEGQALGHFQIDALLGRGHSGVVFHAVDDRNDNAVALKVLSPDFPKTEAELQRFARALKVSSQLSHPHLISVLGAGKTGAYCWIAREYVEGESLAQRIGRLREAGKLDWTRACRFALQLGQVLTFLHEHRVTHGNITPRNILVRRADKVAKLTDLMLSRALEGSALQKAILGKKMLAELPYLPPEQTDPHDPATPAGDIYSLGGVLYALLTGQPPFQGETPREVRAQIREGKVVRPSKLQKGIPPPFEAAVLMMLSRQPEDRFFSAQEMLEAIEAVAAEHDIGA